MARKNTVVTELPDAMMSELYHLRDLVGLAAFVVETRRVADDVARLVDLAASNPGMAETARLLEFFVPNASGWRDMPDTLVSVLTHAHDGLDRLLDMGD